MKKRKVIEGWKYTVAYLKGYDCGINGVNEFNTILDKCPVKLKQWQAGYNKARIKIQAVNQN